MSKQLEVGIAADAGPFDKGIRSGVIEPVEDAQKALDELGKADGLDDLETALKDAQDRTEDLADDTKQAADDIERAYKNAYDGAGKAADKGFDKAKAGAEDFKTESASSAKEAAASFSGSADDIGDTFQEIAANAFSGFGPAGTIAGVAAAAGIGLAIAGFEDVAEAQEASEEAIAEWADKFIEAGGRVLSASQIAASAQDIITDPERWKLAKENAELWGVSVETAVLAASGHAPSIDVVSDKIDAQREAYYEFSQQLDTTSEMRDKELDKLAKSNGAYQKLTDGIAQGKAGATVYSQALLDLISTTTEATKQTDDLGNAVYTLPDGKQIYVDAQTGQASENLDKFQGNLDDTPTEKVTRLRVEVDDSAWLNWRPVIKQGRVTTEPAHGGTYWE